MPLAELVPLAGQVLDGLRQVTGLAVAILLDPLLLVLELGELPVFVKVVALKLVDSRVVL